MVIDAKGHRGREGWAWCPPPGAPPEREATRAAPRISETFGAVLGGGATLVQGVPQVRYCFRRVWMLKAYEGGLAEHLRARLEDGQAESPRPMIESAHAMSQ